MYRYAYVSYNDHDSNKMFRLSAYSLLYRIKFKKTKYLAEANDLTIRS